ncbi:nickel-type superoxide dismutase maturation protease [Prochlorococcus marinus]
MCFGNPKVVQILGLQQAKREDFKGSILISLFLLLIGFRRHCRVVGNSMLPTLKNGDLIIYKPYKYRKDKIIQGSLVVVQHPIHKETLIIKRVSKISSSHIEILGDNKKESIDSRQFGQINKLQVLGIVEKIIAK